MSEKFQELEQTAYRIERSYEKTKRNMTHSERSETERGIRLIKETARQERDNYVRWLWGR